MFSRKRTNNFHATIAPFHSANFKKILRANPEIFRDQNGPFVVNKIFLVQTIIITFIYLLALFIVQNLKKFLQQIQSYEDVPFLDPKQIFFWKIINIILIYLLTPFIVQNSKKILADPEL